MFRHLWGKLLTLLGADPLVSGTIVRKNYYGAGGAVSTGSKIDVISKRVILVPPTPGATETYSFTVRGTDRFGGEVTEEVVVDGLTYNCAEIGDKWPK